MRVSIITVARNSAATIAGTIGSVTAQTYSDIEYIIIDGDSVDGTQAIVEQYRDKVTRFVSEPDRGIYDAMNKGIALASGDVIGILNSDDEYADDQVISDVVNRLTQTSADAAYADLVYVDRHNPKQVLRRWQAGEYRSGAFARGWMPPHPTFFVRRTVYARFGGFSDSLRTAADYEIMLRFIHKHGIPIAYLPRVVTRMRDGGVSNSSLANRLAAYREDRQAWRQNRLRPGLATLLMKRIRKLRQFL
jgi:glycosyltransferase involved in cell wall biosynthesis